MIVKHGFRALFFKGIISTFCIFLVGISIVGSQNSSASSDKTDYLASFSNFMKYAQAFSYECDEEVYYRSLLVYNDPDTSGFLPGPAASETEEMMRRHVPKILYKGLQTLRSINPELVDQAIRSSTEKKLTFFCQTTKNPLPGFRGRHVRESIFSKEYTIDLVAESGILDLFDPESRMSTSSFYVEMREFIMATAERTILHEFLHFLDFDNNFSFVHNSRIIMNPELDLVYACTAQAYPGKRLIDALKLLNGSHYILNSYTTCMTCAAMDFNDGSPRKSEDPDKIRRAKDYCESIDYNYFHLAIK